MESRNQLSETNVKVTFGEMPVVKVLLAAADEYVMFHLLLQGDLSPLFAILNRDLSEVWTEV